MNEVNYIEKKKLPIALDYKSLQEEGLNYIQKHVSTAWSNLNPSDPGVTILEQLCYALTELGYCIDFPIKDILTDSNNKLVIKNQFYLPKDILTTTTVTLQDYKKYLIDRVKGLRNVQTNVLKAPLPEVKGVYDFYILLEDYTLSKEDKDAICKSAFYELNNVRNLGEYFFKPTYLTQVSFEVYGNLEIASGYSSSSVLKNIQYQLNNYVFPDVTQTGYDNLKDKDLSTNEIFNGPILKNGWIPNSSIQSKKNTIKSFEIIPIIESVPGVETISNVSFYSKLEGQKNEISVSDQQIIFLNITESVVKQKIRITNNGSIKSGIINIDCIEELTQMQQLKNQLNSVAAVKMTPDVPKGEFRDIESYYSIQNTFPQSYGLGFNDTSDVSELQIAQVRQLKGYLTLYDQVLINQFSQLANIGKLFSFKNAITGTPFDTENFYSTQTTSEKARQQFPAPFQSFSPTYFYESLYESIPGIEKLLKNYNAYRYSYALKSKKSLDDFGWEKYKESPYNSYVWGLMYYMEDEEVNLERRNDILNHLLARHGESPLTIDTIINNPVYSANIEKDRVIIKSLYLQNLQVLTYHKNKAYNYLGADQLKKDLDDVYELLLEKLQVLNGYSIVGKEPKIASDKDLEATATRYLDEFSHTSQSDFIFNIDRIDEREKVTTTDTINYSTLELKLCLLFGLNEYYQNKIVDYSAYKKNTNAIEIYNNKKNLLWMLTRRKGLILIETNLLINSASFQIAEGDDYLIVEPESPNNFSYNDLICSFQDADNDVFVKRNINVFWKKGQVKSLNKSILSNTIILVFPEFLKTDGFTQQLHFFLKTELPPQLTFSCLFVNDKTLNDLIPMYLEWYNSFIYKTTDQTNTIELLEKTREYSWNLLVELEKINKVQSDE